MFALVPTCRAARGRVRVCHARPAAPRVGAPGARCQPQQKEVSALSAGGLRWQLPPPLPPAPRSEHPAADSHQHPLASAPELSSPFSFPPNRALTPGCLLSPAP